MVVDRNRLSDHPMHVKAIIQRRTWRFSLSRRHHRKQFLPWLLRPLLFEWWELGDVNPVRWNSFTDLHLNLAEKRFKISLFKSAIWGICCKPSSQVHSDWRRLLHMLIERHVWFFMVRENQSLFSFHCFRLIRFFPWSYIPQYWKFNRCYAPTKMPSFIFPILHIPYMQRRATDPLHGDDTYLKKRYSQFYIWRLWML